MNTNLINDNQNVNQNQTASKFKEEELVDQLRYVCDDQGIEKYPKISAKLLFGLAKLYRQKSPDKISLIQSAGLLNASLARKPENKKEIQESLQELCKHVLQLANATDPNTDLIEISLLIKQLVNDFRNEIKNQIEEKFISTIETEMTTEMEDQKINNVRIIQNAITIYYKKIMSKLSKYCESVMGTPPCQYALVGMGSLAKKEITPFSDFENMILLEDGCQHRDDYNEILKYFRWFAVIFQIILINLQETIIPSLAISSLNYKESNDPGWFYDVFTKRGISFDGFMHNACKSPLGNLHHLSNVKFELIKPVSEMFDYVRRAEYQDLFKDILRTTCFVYGNKELHEKYQKNINEIDFQINKFQESEELQKHFIKFGIRQKLTDLKQIDTINVKKVIYHTTTIFISHLGKVNKITSTSSSFEIIEELHKKQIINDYEKHNLSLAIAIACELRLKVYMEKESQDDVVVNIGANVNDKSTFIKHTSISTLLKYFQIAYTLQCFINKDCFYDRQYLLNITICWFFGKSEKYKQMLKLLKENLKHKLEYKNFEHCLSNLQSELKEAKHLNDNLNIDCNSDHDFEISPIDDENFLDQVLLVSGHLYSIGMVEATAEFFQKYIHLATNCSTKHKVFEIALAHNDIGLCLMQQSKYKEALQVLNKSFEEMNTQNQIVNPLNNLGKEHCQTDDKPISVFNKIGDSITNKIGSKFVDNSAISRELLSISYNIGVCLYHLNDCDESIAKLKYCLKNDVIKDTDKVIEAYKYIAYNLWKKECYEEALTYYEMVTVELASKKTSEETLFFITQCLQNCVVILADKEQLSEASKYCKSIVGLLNRFCKSKGHIIDSKRIFYMRYYVQQTKQYDTAIENLNKIHSQVTTISPQPESDSWIALILYNIGDCYVKKCDYKQALHFLQGAIDIWIKHFNKTLSNENFVYIGLCYVTMANCKTELNRNIRELLVAYKSSIQWCWRAYLNPRIIKVSFESVDKSDHLFLEQIKTKSNECVKVDIANNLCLAYHNYSGVLFNHDQYRNSPDLLIAAKECLKLFNDHPNLKNQLEFEYNQILYVLGEILYYKQQNDSALTYLEKCIEMSSLREGTKIEAAKCQVHAYRSMRSILIKSDLHESLKCVNESLQLLENLKHAGDDDLNNLQIVVENDREEVIQAIDSNIRKHMPF